MAERIMKQEEKSTRDEEFQAEASLPRTCKENKMGFA